MKKTILTLSLLTLFSVAVSAQDSKKHPNKNAKEEKSESVTPAATVSEHNETKPVKKGGTRMAINEKGTSGSIQPKHKTEEKKSDAPSGQPGTSGKKD